ncbi:uncharacterized protein FIBRA_08978 [Fibroporia radiculosa]|uniref:F-box domain-containing protein n=1 Tax=Fibroporia radiculosa TaxID=599839 RepID=J4ICM9_9APHY|nr:uncharacterized protein FIBRA_08978 [Fibroporia radiculosa]CCM06691.1 predicted protein [Fibroporia radiculosa]
MNVTLACSSQDAHSVADRDELEDVATAGADGNVRSSCWDASIVERTFSQLCDTCPVVPNRLPTELWEQIIDFIADYGLYDMGRLGQMDKKKMYPLINTLVEHPERCSAIKTVWFDLGQPIGLIGSFAVRMVQKLPRVEFLRLSHVKWETGKLQAQVFLHLTLTFGSVTRLELFNVTFPSAVVFGPLMQVASAVRVPGALRLDAAHLDDSDDVFDFLASIGAHIRHLTCYGRDLDKHSELLAVISESLLSLEIWFSRYELLIDLTPAVNLRVLSLNGNLEEIAKAANLLSRAALSKLAEVTVKSRLLVDVQDRLNSVDNDCFVQMDRIFSGKQFPTLVKITFPLPYIVLEFLSEAINVTSEAS